MHGTIRIREAFPNARSNQVTLEVDAFTHNLLVDLTVDQVKDLRRDLGKVLPILERERGTHTILLRTKCGCTREINKPLSYGNVIKCPFMNERFQYNPDKFPDPCKMIDTSRSFEYQGEICRKTGLKIYQEV